MKVLFLTSLWPTIRCPQYVVFLVQLAKALQKNDVDVSIGVLAEQSDEEYIKYGFDMTVINKDNYERELENHLLSQKYDLIDIHFLDDSKMVKYLSKLCRKQGISLVMHLHGLNVFRNYYEKHPLYCRYLALKKKSVYKKCDAIIGVSNKVCDIYKKGMRRNNAYTVYNGVDLEKFYPSDKKEESDILEIVCVANLIKIKGQEYLIKALKILRNNGYKNFHLSLYGQGVEENTLKNLVNTLDLNDYVDFMGYVEYEKVAEHLQKTDIFIMPSYYEALGCVYLEAMASKVCTIGCRNQGIAEIIEHEKNGLLVDECDEESVFNVLKMLIDDSDKRKAIAQEGYDTVVAEYTWNHMGEKLKNTYIFLKEKNQKEELNE